LPSKDIKVKDNIFPIKIRLFVYSRYFKRNGCGWNAFRDAYKAVAEQLENGTYKDNPTYTRRKYQQPCLAEINEKMNKAY
jgi:argininosuccinate lyase